MIPLIVLIALFLDAVCGAAHPAITPAARLVDRQNLGTVTIWTPFSSGSTIAYGPFWFSGHTVTTSATLWGMCPAGPECQLLRSCVSGFVYYGATNSPCPASATRCGVDYLFSSIGARSSLTRPACFDQGATTLTRTFFVTPTTGASITAPSSQPGVATSIPTASSSSVPNPSISPAASPPTPLSPSPSTHIGAIVGGVVGGLAVIAIAVTAICFLFRRRRQDAGTAPPPTDVDQHSFPSTQPAPATTTYDNKHASVIHQYSQVPGSPPPMYQNQAGQNWNAYAMYGSVQASEMPTNTAAGPHPGGAELTGASSQSQVQHRSPNPATHEMPTA